MVIVLGKEIFGLHSLDDFTQLGTRVVGVHVATYPDSVEWLFPFAPAERKEKLKIWRKETFDQIAASIPLRKVKHVRGKSRYGSFYCEIAAQDVPALAAQSGVWTVDIRSIEGIKPRKRQARKKLEWYAVHLRIAIQVEGQTQGLQTYEERITLVKARDFEDAKKRVCQQYEEEEEAAPYLNPYGEMVRWHLEKVIDIYATWLDTDRLDPKGTEVYSTLKERRIRPQYEWHPRREKTT